MALAVLEDPDVLRYAELLQRTDIRGAEEQELVRIAAYGTWRDYEAWQGAGHVTALGPVGREKLRMATIVTLATHEPEAIGPMSAAELHVLLARTIATGNVSGYISHAKQALIVTGTKGRDVEPTESVLGRISSQLDQWAMRCDTVLQELDELETALLQQQQQQQQQQQREQEQSQSASAEAGGRQLEEGEVPIPVAGKARQQKRHQPDRGYRGKPKIHRPGRPSRTD